MRMISSKGMRVAAAVALTVPAAAGLSQATGVSHPDEVKITTSVEGSGEAAERQSAIPYTTSTAPVLKTRTVDATEMSERSKAALCAADTAVERTAGTRGDAGLSVPADVDAGIVTRMDGPANQLPTGTLMKVKMGQGFSTVSTVAGTSFSAELMEAVERDGRVLLPIGSVLWGRVTDVHGGKRISGAASLHLQPTAITLPNGSKYAVRAQVIDSDLHRATKVDREGTIVRRDHSKETLAVMTMTTGSGAAAGALLGGVPGALIGAGVGAGVSTAVWLKQDHQTGIPVNTRVVFELTSPMVVGGS